MLKIRPSQPRWHAVAGKPSGPNRLLGSLVLLTTLFAAPAAGQTPDASATYLELVARYRGGENTTAAVVTLPIDGIRAVVPKLVSKRDSCPGTTCVRAAALMHTDAALSLVERGRVLGPHPHLDTAWWLLRLDPPVDQTFSGEMQESVKARQAFRRDWLMAVGRLLIPLGDLSTALSLFEVCLEQFPVGTDALLAAGAAQELMGSIDGLLPAATHTGPMVGRPPPRVRFPRDQRRAMQQALRAAEKHYRRAIQLEPGLAEAHLRLGRVLQRRGKAKPARAELIWVVENSQHDQLLALAQLFLGELEESRGQFEEAVVRFRLALKAEPQSQAARLALSQALHRSGEVPASAEAARAVLVREDPSDSWLAYHFAFPKRAESAMQKLRDQVRQ
jgi:tetratricopeptide (TPR) repeat protein